MSATARARQHYFTLTRNPGSNVEAVYITHTCGCKCIVQSDNKGHYRFYCAWCEKYIKTTLEQVNHA